MIVGDMRLACLSDRAIDRLDRMPTIVIGPADVTLPFSPTVRIAAARTGQQEDDTAYRLDGVPIPLTAVLPCEHPTAADVLQKIEQAFPS